MTIENWLRPDANGLYCIPGGFYVDPARPVARALITHGHSDHARPGHQAYLATPETVAIMRLRLGANLNYQQAAYHQTQIIQDVKVTFIPAGHVLGSAQIMLEYQGKRAIISGDYKRAPDSHLRSF